MEEITNTENQLFNVLSDSEKALTCSEIAERLDYSPTSNTVRTIMNNLKKKIPVKEEQKGREKAYSVPESFEVAPKKNGKTCYFCGEDKLLEEHHLVPERMGGKDKEHNLVTVCPTCHQKLEKLYDKHFFEKVRETVKE